MSSDTPALPTPAPDEPVSPPAARQPGPVVPAHVPAARAPLAGSRRAPVAGRPSLVIVGAGPRGTGLLERIAANAPELYAGSELDIHVVDPYPAGAGRI
ncbi:FAD/NAD(P)-binding protein, partial [Streptomyces sp. NPDC127574]